MPTTGEALYDGACVYAAAAKAEKNNDLREKYNVRSVELLRAAFASGFGKDVIQKQTGVDDDPVQSMSDDIDLSEVRTREDYKELLSDLRRHKQ